MPIDGKQAAAIHLGHLARRDVPTCRLDDTLGEVQARVRAAGWDACVVVNALGIVLGLLRREALAAKPDTTVEQVMESGPRSYRMNAELEKAKSYMDKQ